MSRAGARGGQSDEGALLLPDVAAPRVRDGVLAYAPEADDVVEEDGVEVRRVSVRPERMPPQRGRGLGLGAKTIFGLYFTQKFGLRECRGDRRASRVGRARSESSRSRRYVPRPSLFLFAFLTLVHHTTIRGAVVWSLVPQLLLEVSAGRLRCGRLIAG